jgi:hypothetical protein
VANARKDLFFFINIIIKNDIKPLFIISKQQSQSEPQRSSKEAAKQQSSKEAAKQQSSKAAKQQQRSSKSKQQSRPSQGS